MIRNPINNVKLAPTGSLKSANLPESSVAAHCRSLTGLGELREHLVRNYLLEDANIRIQPTCAGSNTFDSFENVEVSDISEGVVALSLSIGFQTALVVRMLARPDTLMPGYDWRPQHDYFRILECARIVYCRSVRDRVVDQMSSPTRDGVVSFFLNSEGQIESASGKAKEFCELRLLGENRIGGYFPIPQWNYIRAALDRKGSESEDQIRKESLVFALHQEGGLVNCLLQDMGNSGFLLSLSATE